MDDLVILQLYEQRSQDALKETAQKYEAYCRSISMNILQNREDAEECVNDTLQKAWDTIPPAKPQSLPAYLGKLTRNLALDRYRASHAEKRGGGRYETAFSELEECLQDNTDPDQIEKQLVIRAALNLFLKELPSEARKMFLRRYWYFSSLNEIAHDFHCSESKVQSILYRARGKLKEQLQTEGVNV